MHMQPYKEILNNVTTTIEANSCWLASNLDVASCHTVGKLFTVPDSCIALDQSVLRSSKAKVLKTFKPVFQLHQHLFHVVWVPHTSC